MAGEDLWKSIYTEGGKKQPLGTVDFTFRNKGSRPSQIRKAIDFIYRRALVSSHRKRFYETVCDTYYLRIRINKDVISTALSDRMIIKELVQFILDGHHIRVGEELAWQNFWRRHGLIVPDEHKTIAALKAEAIIQKKIDRTSSTKSWRPYR